MSDTTDRHVRLLYLDLQRGDIVRFYLPRNRFHWGIVKDTGQVTIIHLEGVGGPTQNGVFLIGGRQYSQATVRIDDFWRLAGDRWAEKDNRLDDLDTKRRPNSANETISRGMRYVGLNLPYALFSSRCKYFVAWCKYNSYEDEPGCCCCCS